MEQEEITEENYRRFMSMCDSYSEEFNSETRRRNKLASQENRLKYKTLLDEYYEFAQKPEVENSINFMYLDSHYYLTIGVGHFLGFNRHGFWDTQEVRDIMRSLEKQIRDEKLFEEKSFKDLDRPEDVNKFLSLSPIKRGTLEMLFCTKYACIGYLDAKRLIFADNPHAKNMALDFQTSQALSTALNSTIFPHFSPIPHTSDRGLCFGPTSTKTDKELAVFKAYVELLGLALKLNTRRKALNRAYQNPFKGKSFFEPHGCNSVVILDEQIKNLADEDMLVKIAEAKHLLNQMQNKLKSATSKEKQADGPTEKMISSPEKLGDFFDSCPITIQLAIMDLAYTGSLQREAAELFVKKEWDELTKKINSLRSSSSNTRNNKVNDWIKAALNPSTASSKRG